jgi:WD40 repeat protein
MRNAIDGTGSAGPMVIGAEPRNDIAKPADTPFAHDAFISYSRKDKEFAASLERALEANRPLKDIGAPQRHLDVFRDEEDFTGVEYTRSVDTHLRSSAKLIVVCSPHARASAYVNDEIRRFAQARGADNIIPVLLSGIPNNEARPDQEVELAFPQALCEVLEIPLAANYRQFDARKDKVNRGAFDGAWYTVLANLYGVSRSLIEQREKRRLARRRRITAAAAGAIILALSAALVVTLISRQEAESRLRAAMLRQLVLTSQSLRDRYPSLATLLAREAVNIKDSTQSHEELFQALASSVARQRVVLPETDVRDATMSPDGHRILLLSTKQDKSIGTIWSADGARQVGTLPVGSGKSILAVGWSPDSQRIAMVRSDEGATLVDASGNVLATMAVDTVYDEALVSWSPAGDRFLLVGYTSDGTLWDLSGHQIATLLVERGSITWSPDGALFSGLDPTRAKATLWDRDGHVLVEVEADDRFREAHLSPAGDKLLGIQEQGPAVIWDAKGTRLSSLGDERDVITSAWWGPSDQVLTVQRDRGTIRRTDGTFVAGLENITSGGVLYWAPDGSEIVASCYIARAICVWNGMGRRLAILEPGPFANLSFAGTSDGENILAIDHDTQRASLWTLDNGTPAILAGHGDEVEDGAWSPDGRRLATVSSDKSARIWDRHGHALAVLPPQDDVLSHVLWSKDGQRIITVSMGGVTRIWSLDGRPLATSSILAGAAVNAAGDLIATTASDGKLEIQNVAEGSRSTLPVATKDIASLVWSPSGLLIAVAAESGPVGIFDAKGSRIATLGDDSLGTGDLAWSPEGNRLFIADKHSTGLVFDLRGEQVARLAGEEHTIYAGFWSPNGRYIATLSPTLFDKSALWNLEGERLAEIPGAGLTTIMWRPDSSAVLTIDMTAGDLWGLDGKKLATLEGHSSRIVAASWSPDGNRLATSSYDGTVHVWDSAGTDLLRLAPPETANVITRCAAWSPDGQFILACSSDHTARIWPATSLLDFAAGYVTRDLSYEERKHYLDLIE